MSSNGISPLQWHPFTTVPGQQPNSMVSIIKQYGKWTGDLMARCDYTYVHCQTANVLAMSAPTPPRM